MRSSMRCCARLHQTSQGILDMLDRLDAWVDEIPLDTRVQRFGNRAFRDWAARLEEVRQPISTPAS